jgi:hypothetical protein
MAFDTNTGNMFEKQAGYSRLDDLVRRMKSSDPFAETQATNSFNNSMAFNAEAEKEPNPVYPTDMMPDVHVENPTLHHVDPIDVNKTVTQAPPDPTAVREEHDAAIGTYMEMDQQIKAAFIEELKNVDPEVGAGVERALGAPGGASAFTDTMKLADPGVSDLYSAINSLIGRNPNDQRVHAAIDKTLSNLHAQTEQQNELASKGKGPAPKIDWTKLETPKQAMEFLARDVTKDPFMQEAADNEKIVQVMEKNFEDYNQIYAKGRQQVVDYKMVEAAGSNEGLKNTLANVIAGGDKQKIEGVKSGLTSEDMAARLPMAEVAGITLPSINKEVVAIKTGVQEVAKATYDPPKLQAANDPLYKISMNMG